MTKRSSAFPFGVSIFSLVAAFATICGGAFAPVRAAEALDPSAAAFVDSETRLVVRADLAQIDLDRLSENLVQRFAEILQAQGFDDQSVVKTTREFKRTVGAVKDAFGPRLDALRQETGFGEAYYVLQNFDAPESQRFIFVVPQGKRAGVKTILVASGVAKDFQETATGLVGAPNSDADGDYYANFIPIANSRLNGFLSRTNDAATLQFFARKLDPRQLLESEDAPQEVRDWLQNAPPEIDAALSALKSQLVDVEGTIDVNELEFELKFNFTSAERANDFLVGLQKAIELGAAQIEKTLTESADDEIAGGLAQFNVPALVRATTRAFLLGVLPKRDGAALTVSGRLNAKTFNNPANVFVAAGFVAALAPAIAAAVPAEDVKTEIADASSYRADLETFDLVPLPDGTLEIRRTPDDLSGSVSFSGTFLGKKITTIGFNSFAFNKANGARGGVTSIALPNTVEIVSSQAFRNLPALTTVKFPPRLKEIGADAFNGCVSLTSAILPEGLETLKRDAFKDCRSLKKVVLPKSLKTIEARAFAGCSSLAEITLPEGVERLESNAFSDCSSLKKVVVLGNLEFGAGTFANCANLEEVALPDRLVDIYPQLFKDCPNVTIIANPGTVAARYAQEKKIPLRAPGEPAPTAATPQAVETKTAPEAAKSEESKEAPKTDDAERGELKRAGVGATGKGGGYGVSSEYDARSIVTVPISAYFSVKEKTVFDMQIPQALKLFQASEGRFPNSEEEFMSKIIAANNIVLPKLPAGDEYVYDVPSATLMIRTAKNGDSKEKKK